MIDGIIAFEWGIVKDGFIVSSLRMSSVGKEKMRSTSLWDFKDNELKIEDIVIYGLWRFRKKKKKKELREKENNTLKYWRGR